MIHNTKYRVLPFMNPMDRLMLDFLFLLLLFFFINNIHTRAAVELPHIIAGGVEKSGVSRLLKKSVSTRAATTGYRSGTETSTIIAPKLHSCNSIYQTVTYL